jgi:hypothetical protein
MNLLTLWYQWTCPPDPGAQATVEQRIRVNRAHQASSLLFWLILAAIFPIPTALQQGNKPLLVILAITIIAYLIALSLNRTEHSTSAGIITMAVLEGGFLLALASLQATGGTHIADLPTVMLLVEGCIVSAAFFDPRITIFTTIANCIIAIVFVVFLPKAPDLAALMQTDGYNVASRAPILIVVVGASLASFATGFIRELRRASRAEEIAALERREVERQTEEIELKQQLEDGVQQVLTTLNEAANGNFEARTRIAKENILFRVGYAVNTLLARLQSFRAERAELEKTRKVAEMLVTAMRDQQPLPLNGWTGTCLDPLIMQLQGPGSGMRPPQQQPTSVPPAAFPPQRKESRNRIV